MEQVQRSDEFGELQRVVDYLFSRNSFVDRIDVVIAAETFDLCEDLREIVALLPSGTYNRLSLCTQLNSSIAGHAWGLVYGTVI